MDFKRTVLLTNLFEAFEAWVQALDEGYDINVVYLDYRKAFDTVSHSKLIEKNDSTMEMVAGFRFGLNSFWITNVFTSMIKQMTSAV